MARPLRIDVKDGWYHTMSRGIEGREIFCEDRYYEHFLELLEEMTGRYAVQVHACALLGNHYHLILRTPQANASAAMQWLNVSYWGRPLALYIARKRSGLTLSQLGEKAGGMQYKTVGKVVERFAQRLVSDRRLRRIERECMASMSNVETPNSLSLLPFPRPEPSEPPTPNPL